MRVLINGLPLFAKRLSEQLQKYDTTSSYIFLDTYNSRWAQLLFYLYLPFSDCVISMNGVTDNSGSLNLVLKRKKKLILQWMGTDALLAMDRFEKRTIDRKYIDYGYNFVDSMWLMEEVKSLGVAAEYMHFKSVNVVPNKHVYDKISVISYVAENRQTFYGMKQIAEIAKEFPDNPWLIEVFDKKLYKKFRSEALAAELKIWDKMNAQVGYNKKKCTGSIRNTEDGRVCGMAWVAYMHPAQTIIFDDIDTAIKNYFNDLVDILCFTPFNYYLSNIKKRIDSPDTSMQIDVSDTNAGIYQYIKWFKSVENPELDNKFYIKFKSD
jgi:hypothetical protein